MKKVTIRISNGLGNQMFQYAFGRALSLKYGTNLCLDVSRFGSRKEQRPYGLDRFAIDAETTTGFVATIVRFFYILRRKAFREPSPSFSPDIVLHRDGFFSGNWQSEKYFKDYTSTIRNDLSLSIWSEDGAKMKDLIETSRDASVSIHIRRGDYAQNEHLTKKHGLMPLSYYRDALAHISQMAEKDKNIRAFIFSDDIAWVKKNFTLDDTPATYVSGNSLPTEEELVLMSLCRHHVIANSTYSWWGAWLDPRPDKIVVAPKAWYANGIDSKDLVPESWIRI